MILLPQEKVIDLYGRNVLIMHGDALCTDDAGYQAFRAKVHIIRGFNGWFLPCCLSAAYRRQNARRQ